VSWSRINVDNSTGDQGPPSTTYTSGGIVYTYFNVYPMHSRLLANGGYLLTVYNDTYNGLAYSLIDLQAGSRVSRVRLVDSTITLYPWIAGGTSKWLLTYSGGGWTNMTLINTDGSNTGLITLADSNSGYVRAAYDSGVGLFPIVYGVRDLSTGNYNSFLVVCNETSEIIGKFIVPINTSSQINSRPINIVVLPGESPGTVVVFAVEDTDLVAYYISPTYPEAQQPIPIPEPLVISIIIASTTGALTAYTIHKVKTKSRRREE